MIYDCFSFFNELDLLDLRLHELGDVVDKFVLVEATMTHSGLMKPLYYELSKERFSAFHSQIIHIVVQDMPSTPAQIQANITPHDRKWLDTGYQMGDNWVRERYQRNQIMQGLIQCEPDDIIIIGDADEIVKASLVHDMRDIPSIVVAGSNCIMQELNTYFMNWRCTNMNWAGSKILRYKFITNPSEDRFHTPAAVVFMDGGWHYNFLGGGQAIRQKIQAYAHQEFNTIEVLENINQRIANRKDVLGRLYEYELIELNEFNTPKYVLEHPEIYGRYIYGQN